MSIVKQKKSINTSKIKTATVDFGNFENQVNISYLEELFKDKVQVVKYEKTDEKITILLGLLECDRFMKYEVNFRTSSLAMDYGGKFTDYKKAFLKQQKLKNKFL